MPLEITLPDQVMFIPLSDLLKMNNFQSLFLILILLVYQGDTLVFAAGY